MSFTRPSAHSVELERSHIAPARLTELDYGYASRVTRGEWQMLLDSWERLQPNADRFATVFFDTLFGCEPTLLFLFQGMSLDTQFIRFAHLLTELVSLAADPDELELGIDTVVHRYAGDSAASYEGAIRAAIAAVLADTSLARLTPETRRSWTAAHAMVVTILRNSAQDHWRGRPTTFMRNTRITVR